MIFLCAILTNVLALIEISAEAENDIRNYVLSKPFSGDKKTGLDEDAMKKICSNHGLDYQRSYKRFDQAMKSRKTFETRFQEFGNPDGYPSKRGFERFPVAFRNGIIEWTARGGILPDDRLDELYNEAITRMRNGVEKPVVVQRALGYKVNVTKGQKKRSESLETSFVEGRVPHFEGHVAGEREAIIEAYRHPLVTVFQIITGQIAVENVKANFNVDHSNKSDYHGWTITKGAGYLASEVVKNYDVTKGDWGCFLKKMRLYGVKEDICNAQGMEALRDLNKRKFIFYYPSMHSGGLSELKDATTVAEKVYHDEADEEDEED